MYEPAPKIARIATISIPAGATHRTTQDRNPVTPAQNQTRCYRRHLHQSGGRLGAWVSRGNRPQKETLGSVSMYPLVLVTCPVDVIVCVPLPPLLPLDDVPMTSTYVCVFWTLVSPPDDALYE